MTMLKAEFSTQVQDQVGVSVGSAVRKVAEQLVMEVEMDATDDPGIAWLATAGHVIVVGYTPEEPGEEFDDGN